MKIYVSNLDFNIGNQDLQDLFSPYGEVTSSNVITDRTSGRSRGFGFVEMLDEGAARTAMNEIDASEVNGRTINVKEANPKTPRPAGMMTGSHY
ncbi:RNA recognition motif domain-containing protein [Flaviaesturariibacter aridisoli]|uniref:RNA-binding protein n=1 Tax=Flaviaesturariibacter aridisoli TaxID=2545761 RepID=A0A4R4DR93_9BACT|nr:RNA-binding protein [Flaviaesturariibacter aridisoli]TCZ64779.1 RNA-binding protein [Flaviaesturariibacter aridisoli]